jgi:hypothetical protein
VIFKFFCDESHVYAIPRCLTICIGRFRRTKLKQWSTQRKPEIVTRRQAGFNAHKVAISYPWISHRSFGADDRQAGSYPKTGVMSGSLRLGGMRIDRRWNDRRLCDSLTRRRTGILLPWQDCGSQSAACSSGSANTKSLARSSLCAADLSHESISSCRVVQSIHLSSRYCGGLCNRMRL